MESPIPSRAPFPWKAFLYAAILGYLALDLHFLQGPLYRGIQRKVNARDQAIAENQDAHASGSPQSIVATINMEPVRRRSLDRAAERYLFLRGQRYDEAPSHLRLQARIVALEQLIDDEILRQYSRLKPVPVPEGEAERRFEEFVSQFESEEAFEARLKLQHLTREQLRSQIAEEVDQAHWIESKIAGALRPSDEEVADWYRANRGSLEVGESVRVSHLFLSTVDPEITGREETIRTLRGRILAGESFEDLARKYSDDPRSKKRGGDLGRMTRSRIPADFADAVFAQELGELGKPFQTSIGWHLAKVTERHPPEIPTLEEMRAEIITEIANSRRAAAVASFKASMRGRPKIHYYEEAIRGEEE